MTNLNYLKFTTKETLELRRFIGETRQRLQEGNTVYKGEVDEKINTKAGTVTVKIYLENDIYYFPKLTFPVFIITITLHLVFNIAQQWTLLSLLPLATSYLYTNHFLKAVMIKGLRKAGHKEEIK